MSVVAKLLKIFREYCASSSVAGLRYIFNQRIHMTERLFWLICVIISATGSYYLIREYQHTFDSNAISLVIESTKPHRRKFDFPAIGVCEEGDVRTYYNFQSYIAEMQASKDNYNKYDVEEFLFNIVFPNMLVSGSISYLCDNYADCEDCVKCPTSGYKELAALTRANCSSLMIDCLWNGVSFNCCDYFQPLQTGIGGCFIMNSLQTSERKKTEFDWNSDERKLELVFAKSTTLHILNAEDIPSFLLEDYSYDIHSPGLVVELQLNVASILNDPEVRDVSPDFRSCRFPDEVFANSSFQFYSFTACVSDCMKKLQFDSCGCVHYTYLVTSDDTTPPCDYNGMLCLDQQDILHPNLSIIQPWRSKGLRCKCLPSCTENEINLFEVSHRIIEDETRRFATIRQSVSYQLFRRQAVRTRLDVVVSIGGILGLLMGASILSAIEFVYFFLVRVCHLSA